MGAEIAGTGRRLKLKLLAAAGGALLIAAAPAPSVAPASVETPSAHRVRAHVEFLADDLLEGRGTGSRGHEIAAAYVASQFRSMGLEPDGENGSWYQWVPMRRASLVAGKTSVSITVAGKTTPVSDTDIGVRPSLAEKVRAFDAGLVFVGYGISDPQLGMDDYRGLDVRGKIVVAFRGTPEGLPSDVAAHLGAYKGRMAAAKGAVGILEIGAQPGSNAAASNPQSLNSTDPITGWVDPSGKVSGSGLRATLVVSRPMAARMFEGAPKTLDAVRAEAAKKGARPKGFALVPTLSIKSETAWNDFRSPEVIGRLPGADPKLNAENVILMGHLDHLGVKASAAANDDRIYNGAIDNGAGVATLLEAARQFVDSGQKPRRSVLFIANTGEELGLLGADYYARHPTVPINKIAAVVDLDMPIPLYDFTDVTAFGAEHSTVARDVAEAARSMNVTVGPDPMPAEAIFVRSDHYRFVERGVPAILLMTGYGNGGRAVWERWLTTVYHSPKDDLNQPIRWNALARYADLNYRISRTLADADARPRWYKGSYFGNLFAPAQPKADR
jgi:Zn-dependent M28 family amino/carboxypeptidase